MLNLESLRPEHFEALFAICMDNFPYLKASFPSLWHFQLNAAAYEGFVLVDDKEIVRGAITFSDLIPLRDCMLNIDVQQEFWYSWASRQNFKTICDFAFNKLKLPRMSSRTIKNLTCHSEPMLIKAGFRTEGVVEDALLLPDGFHDMVLWAMLRRRCKWL